MFTVISHDAKEMERDLKAFAHRAYPFATRNTLNDAAFANQRLAKEDIRRDLTLRNKFSERSIQVDKARTLNVARQSAHIGSTAIHMERLEFGEHKTGGKRGVAIVTAYSANQRGANPRTKMPVGANKLARIALSRKHKGKNRRQSNLIKVRTAAASSNKFVFMDLGKKQGIFRITGGKRKPKVQMVADMSERTTTVKPYPWLRPTFDRVIPMMPSMYEKSLLFQVKRQGLFRGP